MLPRKKVISRSSWKHLTFRQKEIRLRSLEALALMRKEGKSMSAATRETGISATTFRRHVGKTISKRNGRLVAKTTDRISRMMTIFSNGRRYNIETRSSKTASVIGRYNSAVGRYAQTGDASNLGELEGVTVRDAAGRKYLVETRPKKVISILERLERPDVPTIYAI